MLTTGDIQYVAEMAKLHKNVTKYLHSDNSCICLNSWLMLSTLHLILVPES